MSIFDHPDRVPPAASWRCPHCGTLQAETSHCWRCDRGAVTCATCHLFRTAVASDLGYCAADGSRTPLTGEEFRSCWQVAPAALDTTGLFTDPTPVAVPVTASDAAVPPPTMHRPPARAARPPLEEPRAAAWVEEAVGELVEAPPVPPSRRVTTEIQRRRRWWRRGGSAGR